MAGTGSDKPRTPGGQATPPRKPLAILHISKRDEEERRAGEADAGPAPVVAADPLPARAEPPTRRDAADDDDLGGLTMADLLGAAPAPERQPQPAPAARAARRSVDDFDFDEQAFLAALDENEPVGTTGEVVNGVVVEHESDGIYVDIGGKAPGFMPKAECGLGVITDLKNRFPKGTRVDVLVTGEQNADGMVTISCRALALRQAWEKVRQLEKEGRVLQVKVTGFNRGGVTVDVEGLRGFIPRSQLQEGDNHEALVGRTLGVTFLEVSPETRKLVLSEKRAATAARFAELEVGQLVSGQVASLKPYGFFIDLGGVSGLLHQSCVTGGGLRDLREAFSPGETIQALVTDLDPGRGRIALNTALLENQPGELLIDKATVMAEARDRANRARQLLRQQDQSAG